MWKKEDATYPAPMPRAEPVPAPRSERVTATERVASSPSVRERATIGRSITIRGEVTGDEDLLIEGRVEGSVNLQQHAVTVGPAGDVRANIVARVVTVEGNVEGNLQAEEQVILRSTALVQGDIAAPRLVLEDGARFSGGVDMSEVLDRAAPPTTPARTGAAPRPESVASPTSKTSTDSDTDEDDVVSGTGDGVSSRGAATALR
jgi:cytoskeletal protein CcmA (bactofilin family)